jgi:hypothetical protein
MLGLMGTQTPTPWLSSPQQVAIPTELPRLSEELARISARSSDITGVLPLGSSRSEALHTVDGLF